MIGSLPLLDFSLELECEVTALQSKLHPGVQEYNGIPRVPPSQDHLCEQLVAAGLQIDARRGPDYGPFSVSASRREAVVTIHFYGAGMPLFAHAIDHAALPALQVDDGHFTWHERRWPVFFTDGKLSDDNRAELTAEGRVDDDAAATARYAQWARANGFTSDPESPAEWYDGRFTLRVQSARGALLLLLADDAATA